MIKGYNINFPLTNTKLEAIKAHGFKYLRLAFLANSTSDHTWNQSQQNNIFELNASLPKIQELGLKVIIDMHHWPYIDSNYSLMLETPRLQDVFINRWVSIAQEYKNNPNIHAYELINEPPAGYGKFYRPFINRLITEIRKVDPDRLLIIPSLGTTAGQFTNLAPFEGNNLAYAFHLWDWPRITITDAKIPWNVKHENEAKELISKVKEWQRKYKIYNSQIYVTEVGCFRSSGYPSYRNARKFFSQVLPLLNDANWNYFIHSFRDADCWDYEKGYDPSNQGYITNPIMNIILRHSK